MSLFLATLLPGLFLTALGALLLPNHPVVISTLKALPRSLAGTLVFFGGGALWFLVRVANMGDADRILGSSNIPWVVGFAALGVLSIKYVPDFLAVRGLGILTLLTASTLLDAAFMQYDQPQRLFLVTFVFVAILAALYLVAVPYRLRDFFQWLFATPGRARVLGAGLLAYGLLLNVVAFTY
ncbi:MAG: hypothetical protein WC485_06515 [Opitutaceae bacterium]